LPKEKTPVKEGIYYVDVGEKEIKANYGRANFGIPKIEIGNNNIKISFYVKWINSTGSYLIFELEEAYIVDNMLNRHDFIKVEGLESGRQGTTILGVKVGGTSRDSKFYSVKVHQNSRIWGTLYFPKIELNSPEFLLYINGQEIEVKFASQQKY
jgi:hypothetical protein